MKVMIKTSVYSKKNGLVYKNIKHFEGSEDECKKFVFDNYQKKIEKGQILETKGFLSKKYITLK